MRREGIEYDIEKRFFAVYIAHRRFFGIGQLLPERRFLMKHERVYRNSRDIQCCDGIDIAQKPRVGLTRIIVYQVDARISYPRADCRRYARSGKFAVSAPAEQFSRLVVKALDADGKAVYAALFQRGNHFIREFRRRCLDADFRIGRYAEASVQFG